MNLSSSFSMRVVMKALEMSTVAASIPSFASMVAVRRTDSRDAVGEAASDLSMVPLYLLSPETMRPLMESSRFSLKNRCDSRTWSYSCLLRVLGLMGSNVIEYRIFTKN